MFSLVLGLLAFAHLSHAASQIALFTDDNCQNSFKGIEGPNGYPNGSCTDLRRNGPYGSFQVVGLDPGCAVTIYVEDLNTTICGGYQEEIRLAQCNNASFVYYSIDMCDPNPPSDSPISPISLSPSPTPAAPSSGPSTGTIVGAVVGSICGVGLLVGIAAWILIRRRRAGQTVETEQPSQPAEMYSGVRQDRHEMSEGPVAYKGHALEVVPPPVELEGQQMSQHMTQDKPRTHD